ncbi:MAG: YncE family protein, partial [Chloroflexota bacterium]
GYDNRIYDTDPVAVDTALGRAVVVSGTNGQGTAQIIDLATRRMLRTMHMDVQPTAVQIDPALHRAYVLDFGSCIVNILDLRSDKQVATVAVGLRSTGLAVNTATGKVFVSSPHAPTSHVLIFPANIVAHQSGCWSPVDR